MLFLAIVCNTFADSAPIFFTGHITATQNRGGELQTIFYTAGTNVLRIECLETNRPYAKNLIARDSGVTTLVFPHNRSFMRLPLLNPIAAAPMMPPVNLPSTASTALPALPAGMPAMPAMPSLPTMPMPPMPEEALALNATGLTTNLLGYTCEQFTIAQRGEIMEIWATTNLFAFQSWQQNQPPRFGPQMIEEKWSELLRAKKLFPLRAVLKMTTGPERFRFEVNAITTDKIAPDADVLYLPPADYVELAPLPF